MEKPALNPQLVVSDDGSHTLKVAELKEHYHSHKGAIQESEYVFIRMGLEPIEKQDLNILEVGFGTGLNALLTALNSEAAVTYTTLEPFPVDPALIDLLNYPELLDSDGARSYFKALHKADWDKSESISQKFTLNKLELGLEGFDSRIKFDLVYYDAFAPHAQPELWKPWVWEKLYEMLADEGIIVTYCAKGQVRRDMQSAGLQVERLPGPPGKREMLRARKGE